ncbi:MAG: response regulator [Anaerolineae bacterium]
MAEGPIRILIADDHAVVRKGLVMVLTLEPDFEVVAEADNGREAVQLAQQLQPHLVLLDMVMPGMKGEETVLALRAAAPDVKILVLSGAKLDDQALDMLAAGVDGYVLKNIKPDELAQAIRTVDRGEAYLHPALAQRVLKRVMARRASPPLPQVHLTAREQEILRWMATPATYREIAEELFITEATVRSHAKNILSKLQQPNRTQAVLAALRANLLDLPDLG